MLQIAASVTSFLPRNDRGKKTGEPMARPYNLFIRYRILELSPFLLLFAFFLFRTMLPGWCCVEELIFGYAICLSTFGAAEIIMHKIFLMQDI